MAGKIQKLKEELNTIEQQTSLISLDLRESYNRYLNLLSESIKRQLVLAAYQICTQVYPRAFIGLSYSQREKLQENLKELGNNAKEKVMRSLEKSSQSLPLSNISLIEKMLLNISALESQSDNLENSGNSEPSFLSQIAEENSSKISNPDELIYWTKTIEKLIINALDNLSKEANHCLQQAHILPSQLPPQVLDMAIQAEEAGQPMSGGPNLLNVLVETGRKSNDEDEDEDENDIPDKITKITAIHLRLAEIELVDANLSIHKKEIRTLLEKINQLRKNHHKKQRELAIAEAETAWRASWYD